MLVIEKMQPLTAVDWEKVEFFQCTLEKPYQGGPLRFRLGTADPKENLNHDPRNKRSGPKFFPGKPLMWPEDEPAVAGDPARDNWIMPASITATIRTRGAEVVGDPVRQVGYQAFGYFMAPLTDEDGLSGFTQSAERVRVASFWNWFKMPPGDGTLRPPMNRVGPPAVPAVAIKLMDRNMKPIKVEGSEVIIRPREFYNFDDMSQYDTHLDTSPKDDLVTALRGFSTEEIEGLRALLKGGKSGPK